MALKKKDLQSAIDTGLERLFSTADAQEVPQEQDRREAAEARRTQGRKGYKLQRLNISLTPSQYDYVRTMAAISGKSQTCFIGELIDRAAEENRTTYNRAKELLGSVK